MTLRSKTLLASGITVAALIVVCYAVATRLLLAGFAAVEHHEDTQNMERTAHALDSVLVRLDDALVGWSQWDDSYSFIRTNDPKARQKFITGSLSDEPLAQCKSDVIIYIRNNGQMVYGTGYDRKAAKKAPLPPDILHHLSAGSILLRHRNTQNSQRGIVLLPRGPLLLVSRPIVTNAGKGPIYGSLLWGRFLDDAGIKELSQLVALPLIQHQFDSPRLPADFQVARLELARSIAQPYVRAFDEDTTAGYIAVRDIYGKPALLVRADMPRDIYQQGQVGVRYLLLSLLIVGLIFSAITLFMLERWVLARLSRLSRSVEQITASGDVSTRVPEIGEDELAHVAGAINRMLEGLESAQHKLRQSKEQLRLALQAGHMVVWEWNPVTNQVASPDADEASPLLPELATSPQSTMDTFLENVYAEDRDRVEAANARILETSENPPVEFRIVQHDGSLRWLESKGQAFADETGQGRRVIGVSMDVTERKAAEAALHQAREEAERANRAKSEFLSRMSHELRTPMNAILGFGQLLEMGELDTRQREGVEHILKGGQHLLDLINEVLDLARIESERLSLSPEPVCAGDVIRESLDLVQPLAARRDIAIHLELDGNGEQYVRADRQRLKQVILNLLSNAIKYNRDGGTVTVSCEEIGSEEVKHNETTQHHLTTDHSPLATHHLRIKVRDTGAGIKPDQLEKLFIPFERLGAEQSAIEGTGLGLAVTKRLMELMDGQIGVQSTPGQGTTFWVGLPLTPRPELPASLESSPEAERSEPPSTRRVLLYIEDNLPNVTLIQHILGRRPEVRLLLASEGLHGLELAREHHPHLILLDLHLPDIMGDEVLRRLQAAPETRDIPVVMISADATPRQIERLLAAGARAYLTKPFDVRQFLQVVQEILDAGDET